MKSVNNKIVETTFDNVHPGQAFSDGAIKMVLIKTHDVNVNGCVFNAIDLEGSHTQVRYSTPVTIYPEARFVLIP